MRAEQRKDRRRQRTRCPRSACPALPPDRASNKFLKGGFLLPKCLSVARTAYPSDVLREVYIGRVFIFMSVQSFSHTTPDT